MLFITQNCLYCLYVTAWFLKRWNKLWKPQQGSLLNIKSMHYICWNPGEPKAAMPNSRVCTQQEPCGKRLHLGSKFGLLAVILWKPFGGSSVEVLELRVLPVHLQQHFWYSRGHEKPWTIQGRTVRGTQLSPVATSGLSEGTVPRWCFNVFSEKSFPPFSLCWKTGSSLSWPKCTDTENFNGIKKLWKAPNTRTQIRLMFKQTKPKSLEFTLLNSPNAWGLSSHCLCTQESIKLGTESLLKHHQSSTQHCVQSSVTLGLLLLLPAQTSPATHFSILISYVCLGAIKSSDLDLMVKYPVPSANCQGGAHRENG